MNNLEEYQKFTKTTAIYPKHKAIDYLTMGLVSECGEVAGVVKKWIRGDYTTDEMDSKLKHELGDCLWYITRLADERGLSLIDIFQLNVDKLQSRKERDQLSGSGDDR